MNCKLVLISAVLFAAFAQAIAFSADAPASAPAQSQAATAWTPIPDSALPAKTSGGAKLNTIGKGAFAGIAVDPATGDVYALVNNHGVWKSTDQAANFQEPASVFKGRPTCTCSFNANPAGKGLACFLEYGTGGITTDAGKTWTPFKVDAFLPKVFDVGAVDWENSAGKTLLALVHESKGKLVLSADAGQSWTELGAGFRDRGPIGVFDEKTLVAAKSGKQIERSTDAGKTWQKAADLPGKCGQIVYVFKSTGYLLTEKGLFVSKDKGATWNLQGSEIKATTALFFGQDENHLAAVGDDVIYETVDAGKTWKPVAPLAPNIGPRDYTYAWDPVHDIFYVAQMNKPAMKCIVTPPPATAPAAAH